MGALLGGVGNGIQPLRVLGSYPVKWVNSMTSFLELLPSGTAATMTFTMLTTWLMENALKTTRRVSTQLKPAYYMVLARDPGAMK